MIEESLFYIKEELLNYLINDIQDSGVEVELGNIALFETDNTASINEKIIITLVNIEEESTLKNNKNVHYGSDGSIKYVMPPIYLNLYLLFCCNYALYNTSLKRLGHVIGFFQQRKKFEIKSTTSSQNEHLFKEEDQHFKLIFELYTLTFEQINHLWGALGGRQLPSVMFKARLVKVDDSRIFKKGPPIEEIQASVQSTNEC